MTCLKYIEKVLNTMRLLLIIIFILSLQTFTKADDIRDFEMEGISIGDSLLDFYSVLGRFFHGGDPKNVGITSWGHHIL